MADQENKPGNPLGPGSFVVPQSVQRLREAREAIQAAGEGGLGKLKVEELRSIAEGLRLDTEGLKKDEIVAAIQGGDEYTSGAMGLSGGYTGSARGGVTTTGGATGGTAGTTGGTTAGGSAAGGTTT